MDGQPWKRCMYKHPERKLDQHNVQCQRQVRDILLLYIRGAKGRRETRAFCTEPHGLDG